GRRRPRRFVSARERAKHRRPAFLTGFPSGFMALRLLSSACIGAMAFAAAAAAYADIRVEGELPEALRDRINAVLPDTDTPENRVQARRMARDAAIRIEALLRS